jgi:hypothetical protein
MLRFRLLGLTTLAFFALTMAAQAQILSEGFDNVSNLTASGWSIQNNSVSPSGTIFQGNDAVFPAHSGATTSYAGMNYQATSGTTGTETISVWMLAPVIPLDNAAAISFYTRTVDVPQFPDRLQVRYSTNGSSTNVGTTETSVGDFSNLLLDINPNYTTTDYPNTWTNFSPTIDALPAGTTGRIAFRYFVENGGPVGNNSDYIGIDTLTISAVPEPVLLPLTGIFAIGALWRRKR